MKNISFIIFFSLIAQMGISQGIEFIHEDLAKAKEQAIKTEKIIFVDAYTTWCGPCKKLSRDIFPQKAAGDFFNANFINLKLDMEKGDGLAFGMKYNVKSYPTLLFITPEGELVMKSIGGRDVNKLLETGQKALESFDFSAAYAEDYEKGDRSFDLVYNYIKALNKSGKPSLKIANDYFRNHPDISEKQNIKLLSVAAVEADSKLFDAYIDNKASIVQLVTKEVADAQIIKACGNTAKKAVEYESVDLLWEALNKARMHAPDLSDDVSGKWIDSFFSYTKNATEFSSFLTALPKSTHPKTRSEMGVIALNSFGDSNSILEQGIKQTKLALKSDKKNYNYTLLLTKLYVAMGDNNNAKKYGNKAIELAENRDSAAKEVSRILESI